MDDTGTSGGGNQLEGRNREYGDCYYRLKPISLGPGVIRRIHEVYKRRKALRRFDVSPGIWAFLGLLALGVFSGGCAQKADSTMTAAPPPGPNARPAPVVNDPKLSVGP